MLSCTVCYELFVSSDDVHAAPCGHILHFKCWTDWLKRSGNCPDCRKATRLHQLIKLYFNSGEGDDFATLKNKYDSLRIDFVCKTKDCETKEITLISYKAEVSSLSRENKRLKTEIEELKNFRKLLDGARGVRQDLQTLREFMFKDIGNILKKLEATTEIPDESIKRKLTFEESVPRLVRAVASGSGGVNPKSTSANGREQGPSTCSKPAPSKSPRPGPSKTLKPGRPTSSKPNLWKSPKPGPSRNLKPSPAKIPKMDGRKDPEAGLRVTKIQGKIPKAGRAAIPVPGPSKSPKRAPKRPSPKDQAKMRSDQSRPWRIISNRPGEYTGSDSDESGDEIGKQPPRKRAVKISPLIQEERMNVAGVSSEDDRDIISLFKDDDSVIVSHHKVNDDSVVSLHGDSDDSDVFRHENDDSDVSRPESDDSDVSRRGNDDSDVSRHENDDSDVNRHENDSDVSRHESDDSDVNRHENDSDVSRHESDDSDDSRHESDDSDVSRRESDDSDVSRRENDDSDVVSDREDDTVIIFPTSSEDDQDCVFCSRVESEVNRNEGGCNISRVSSDDDDSMVLTERRKKALIFQS